MIDSEAATKMRAAQMEAMQAHRSLLYQQHQISQLSQQAMILDNTINRSCIVAIDTAGSFSKLNEIPWNISQDRQMFKSITVGGICVMGRVTYDGIVAYQKDRTVPILPGRKVIVVSTTMQPVVGIDVVHSFEDIDKCITHQDIQDKRTVFYCGGADIYRRGIVLSNTVHITIVNTDVSGDRKFPMKYLFDNFTSLKGSTHTIDALEWCHTTWSRRR